MAKNCQKQAENNKKSSNLLNFGRIYIPSIRPGKNVFFPASWAKFPSSRADFPPVWDGFPYVFLYFFPPNHKISRQGASRFAYFFQACPPSPQDLRPCLPVAPWDWMWHHYVSLQWTSAFYIASYSTEHVCASKLKQHPTSTLLNIKYAVTSCPSLMWDDV